MVIPGQISCEAVSLLGVIRTSKENTELVLIRAGGVGILHILAPIASVHDPGVVVVDTEYLAHLIDLNGGRGDSWRARTKG